MVELKKQELFNIQGGGFYRTSSNFEAYVKISKWICKIVRSWF